MDEAATRPDLVDTAVIMYTSRRILTGIIRLPAGTRLSDRLNRSPDDFLTIHDPRIIDLEQGWVEPISEAGPWFVHRSEVLVLHEVSTPAGRGRVVGIPQARVPRCPVIVRAYVGHFRVVGTLHLPPDCDVPTFLNGAPTPFLPITFAQIALPGRKDLDVVQVPFALLNRNRLVISEQAREDVSPATDRFGVH